MVASYTGSRFVSSSRKSLAISSALLLSSLAMSNATAATGWTSTRSHAVPLGTSVLQLPTASSKRVNIAVSLKLQNTDALKQFLKNQSTPGNPQYGVTLTPAQFAAAYGPSSAQANAVAAYLTSAGFTNVKIAPNLAVISATGTVASAEQAFNTRIASFLSGGELHFANVRDVQLPDSLNGSVLSVLGLNDINLAKTANKVRSAALPALNFSYDARQFQTVYNAGSTPTGGKTVLAIVSAGDDLSQVVKDLRQYETSKGLPQVPVTIVNVMPPGTDTSGDGEWALDSQSSSGIAGDLKEMIFYNTASLADADLLLAYNRFVSDGRAKVGNMSFGGCEVLSGLLGGLDASDQAFMQAAAQGQTWFASSGDAGAACTVAVNLGIPDSGIPDVEYPASSPYVVAVGGTTLLSDAGYGYSLEVSWDAGGGGTSLFETAPSWQSGIVPLGTVGLRGVPDIAMDADPNTGAELIVDGASTVIGGTSLSSPLSAGVWARLQSAHCNAYGFAAPIIYALDTSGIPLSTAKGFHDVLAGTNGLWLGTPGWDYTTGFGSFDITAVNAALPATTSCTS